jgi:hypothetical protein
VAIEHSLQERRVAIDVVDSVEMFGPAFKECLNGPDIP